MLDNWEANGDDVTDLRCKLYYHSTDSKKLERLTSTFISVDDMVEGITFPAGKFVTYLIIFNTLPHNVYPSKEAFQNIVVSSGVTIGQLIAVWPIACDSNRSVALFQVDNYRDCSSSY